MTVKPQMMHRLGKRGCWLWLTAVALLIVAAVWAVDKTWPLPLREVDPARVMVVHDDTPLWRFTDAEGIWRYLVAIDKVPLRYLETLISHEDRWFWKHPGINPSSVLRAAWQDLSSGHVVSGGSTLAMQAAQLLDPYPRTSDDKFCQLWHALQLGWHLSKHDILTLHLDRMLFGGTLQGVRAVSQAYPSKPPAQLGCSDAALLAVLPQAPSRLCPDRWSDHVETARNEVLERMASQGIWPARQVQESRGGPVQLSLRQMP